MRYTLLTRSSGLDPDQIHDGGFTTTNLITAANEHSYWSSKKHWWESHLGRDCGYSNENGIANGGYHGEGNIYQHWYNTFNALRAAMILTGNRWKGFRMPKSRNHWHRGDSPCPIMDDRFIGLDEWGGYNIGTSESAYDDIPVYYPFYYTGGSVIKWNNVLLPQDKWMYIITVRGQDFAIYDMAPKLRDGNKSGYEYHKATYTILGNPIITFHNQEVLTAYDEATGQYGLFSLTTSQTHKE